MKLFFNTTNETGKDLAISQSKAKTQQDEILGIYKSKISLTASEAWKEFGSDKCPLTSIRRAITNLTTEGELYKSNDKKIGVYGKPEYEYKLLKNQMELF